MDNREEQDEGAASNRSTNKVRRRRLTTIISEVDSLKEVANPEALREWSEESIPSPRSNLKLFDNSVWILRLLVMGNIVLLGLLNFISAGSGAQPENSFEAVSMFADRAEESYKMIIDTTQPEETVRNALEQRHLTGIDLYGGTPVGKALP